MRKTVNDFNLTKRAPSTAPWRKVFSSVSWGEKARKSAEPTSSPLQINKGKEDTGAALREFRGGGTCVQGRGLRGVPCHRSRWCQLCLRWGQSLDGPRAGLICLAPGASGCSWSLWFWALASSCEILPHRRVLPPDADLWGDPCVLTSGSLSRTVLARPSSCAGASSPLPQAALGKLPQPQRAGSWRPWPAPTWPRPP